MLAEEYGSLRNLHRGNKSKRFKNQTCYERRIKNKIKLNLSSDDKKIEENQIVESVVRLVGTRFCFVV
jgi:hypothetical protein